MVDQPAEPLTIALQTDMALGRTLRCFQGHVWDHYEAGYEATITMLVPELRVAFDCPECHSLLIEEVPAGE